MMADGGGGAAIYRPQDTWRRVAPGTALLEVHAAAALAPNAVTTVTAEAPSRAPAEWLDEREARTQRRFDAINPPDTVRVGRPIDSIAVGAFAASDPAICIPLPLTVEQRTAYNRWVSRRLRGLKPRTTEWNRVKLENDDTYWLLVAAWIMRALRSPEGRPHAVRLAWLLGHCEANLSAPSAWARSNRDRFGVTDVSKLYDWACSRAQEHRANGRQDHISFMFHHDLEYRARAQRYGNPRLGALRKAIKDRQKKAR